MEVSRPSMFSRVFGRDNTAGYDPIKSFMERKLYDSSEDIVVVGNEAWKMTLTSMDESLRRPIEAPEVEEFMEEELPSEVSSLDISIPKLAFIPGRNMVYLSE